MISEIKQRIAQLNNGEVPSGYEKTEFGIFPCDWVVDKRLKDIGTFGKGKGLPGDKMTLEGVPCVGYGDIYMKYNNFHFEKAKSFVDKETASKSQPIQKGTLLFTGTGETAEEIGKCVCYNGDETIYAGGDIITFISNEVNPLFLAYQQYQDFSLRNKASFGQGHSVVHIRQNNLEKLHVAYPKSADEQSKIAEILMKWDEAIELYNQYIEKLKQLKSIWLKKMFPQKGERVPEMRFKGFTDAWEQRKLGELSSLITKGTTPLDRNNSGIVSFVKIESIDESSGDITITQRISIDEHNGYLRRSQLKENDILFSIAGTLGRVTSVKSSILPANTNQALAIIRLKEGCLDYVKTYLKGKAVAEFIKKNPTIGAQPNLSLEQVANLEIAIPSASEQVKIGNYFEKLDNLITLHQCNVEKIKAQQKVLQKYLLNGIVRA